MGNKILREFTKKNNVFKFFVIRVTNNNYFGPCETLQTNLIKIHVMSKSESMDSVPSFIVSLSISGPSVASGTVSLNR
jgi:hypothetical protein